MGHLLILTLAFGLMAGTNGAAMVAAAPAQSRTVGVASLLGADGTYVGGGPGLNANVNSAGWQLTSNVAAGEAPRFEPASTSSNALVAAASWSPLGSNGSGDGALNQPALALAVWNGDLFVGGAFFNAGNKATADYVARWNGTSWSGLGSNGAGDGALNATVHALGVFQNALIVGGDFTNAAGITTADYIARWNGTVWSNMGTYNGSAVFNAKVRAISATDEDLYVGGNFSAVMGNPAAQYAARWSGSAWGSIDGANALPAALNGPVHAVAATSAFVYFGGEFLNAHGDATADYFAKWDGSWHGLGSNGAGNGALNSVVYAIAINNFDVYVGGSFQNAAGKAKADYIARWNGSTWNALGSNGAGDGALNYTVEAIVLYKGSVYAGGDFGNAAGIATADKIAKWNGSSWSGLGSNGSGGALGAYVAAIAFRNGYLYAAGGFPSMAGEDPAMDYVAAYGPLSTPKFQPDGRIKKGKNGTLVGNNIYNLTGSSQVRTATIAVGSSASFFVSIQNDGTANDSFYVLGMGGITTGFSFRYFHGTTEITSAVNAGTYRTTTLTPGSTFTVKVVAYVSASAAVGSANTRYVRIASYKDGTKVDVVKFIAYRA